MTAYLRPSSRGQPNSSIEFYPVESAPTCTVTASDVPAGPGDHPPFPAICTPEWSNKANKIKGTGQATLTTKIERLTTVKVTDVRISGDEK